MFNSVINVTGVTNCEVILMNNSFQLSLIRNIKRRLEETHVTRNDVANKGDYICRQLKNV